MTSDVIFKKYQKWQHWYQYPQFLVKSQLEVVAAGQRWTKSGLWYGLITHFCDSNH